MSETYIDPNSGAAPQPGGMASPVQQEIGPEATSAREQVDAEAQTETQSMEADDATEATATETETVTAPDDNDVDDPNDYGPDDDYDDKSIWSYDGLRAEIHRRNEDGREGSISAQGSRDELIHRLREDDATE